MLHCPAVLSAIFLPNPPFLFQLKALKKKQREALLPPTMSGKKVAELSPPPEFIAAREALWQRLKAEREAWLAAQAPQHIWCVR